MGLGHGFQVETRIIVWEDNNALIVPSSALFREGQRWAVFLVEEGRAKLRQVDIRSEEHTSELQSRPHLVCRLLLEKKNKIQSIEISEYLIERATHRVLQPKAELRI